MKYNKIYINSNNVNADYMRNQMADDYHRKEKIDKIIQRMGKLERIMMEKQFYNMEKQKIQEELSEEKKSDIKQAI